MKITKKWKQRRKEAEPTQTLGLTFCGWWTKISGLG
jgi:hypothetical protein